MPKLIIRDDVDIDIKLTDDGTVNNDNGLLDDSINLKDETIRYNAIDLRHQHLKIYSLLTTSDKEINLRMYPDEHVQNMIKDNRWITPYRKPLLLNHHSTANSYGRFLDNWYVDNKTHDAHYGLTTLPKAVIDEFDKRGAFDSGTGSAIGLIETSDSDVKRKIIDGTYLTTSQGATTESLTCNICGESYYNCSHFRGSTYPIFNDDGKSIKEMRRCIPATGALDALEDSIVGTPANDTSTLLVYDEKKGVVVTMDNINEYGDIFNVISSNTANDNQVSTSDNRENLEDAKGKTPGLTQQQIDKIAKLLKEGKTVDATILTQTTDENFTENNLEDKITEENKGGNMAFKTKNATAKRILKQSLADSKVTDNDKINKFFDELKDEELDTIMYYIDFIESNKDVEQEKPVVDNEATEEPLEDETQNNPITDNTELQKQLKDLTEKIAKFQQQEQQYKDALAKAKGLDNTVPNLSDLGNTESTITNNKKYNF